MSMQGRPEHKSRSHVATLGLFSRIEENSEEVADFLVEVSVMAIRNLQVVLLDIEHYEKKTLPSSWASRETFCEVGHVEDK